MSQISLTFDGKDMNHSVDAFDLASTIIAFGRVIEDIAETNFLKKDDKLQININAFNQGSFESIFDINLIEAAGVVTTGAKVIIDNVAGNPVFLIIKSFRQLVELKKFLQGKPPQKIEVNSTQGDVMILNFNGDNIHVDLSTLRSLQSKSTGCNLKKMVETIEKNDVIDSIVIAGNDVEPIQIQKPEVTYFDPIDESQTTDNHRVKGVVSKLDTKTETGYLTIGSRRVGFYFGGLEDNVAGDAFFTLAESMKQRISIFLIGSATFDLESNIKKMDVKVVESEAKLF